MKFRMLIASLIAGCLLIACDDVVEFSAFEGDNILCQPKCKNGFVCINGACISTQGSCKDGEVRCNGRQPQYCSESVWHDSDEKCMYGCKDGECSIDGGSCYVDFLFTCTNNLSHVGQVYQCIDQKWIFGATCPDNRSCKPVGNQYDIDILCGECTDGAGSCDVDENSGVVSYRTCQNGQWSDALACQNSCDSIKGCDSI